MGVHVVSGVRRVALGAGMRVKACGLAALAMLGDRPRSDRKRKTPDALESVSEQHRPARPLIEAQPPLPRAVHQPPRQ